MGTGGGQVRGVGRELGSRFGVEEGYAWYRGESHGGSVHRHAAFQLVLARRGEAALAGADGTVVRGAALLVPPMTAHRMLSAGDLLTVVVEPHSVLADRLRGRCGSGSGIVAVPELGRLDEAELGRAAALPSAGLDPRLLAAAALLEGLEEPVPMEVVAARVGLSPQRLRALARQQLGMPLARRRIWLKLRRSAEALGEGQSPAEAAAAGGFADQAHLTHRIREMIGMTPAAVVRALRAPAGSAAGAPGDVHRDRSGDGRDDLGLADLVESGLGDEGGQEAVGVGLGVGPAVGELDDAERGAHQAGALEPVVGQDQSAAGRPRPASSASTRIPAP
ncbi:helix-turn-helix domain-containing protein [Streptomyces sp. NPDC089795]|uniref:helix-turn-helix domain-containing protein n=1 Tax=Streptomyces sp. NPDC089795 TaxID=3155297 RepID=UPI0034380677